MHFPVFDFLNYPYPISLNYPKRLKLIFITGLCVFAFFAVFKPFHLDRDPISFVLKFSVYVSSVGCTIAFINFIALPKLFPGFFMEAKWTLKRVFIWELWGFFSFATVMFMAVSAFYGFRQFSITGYLTFLYIQVIFGMPLSIIINLVTQNYLLKKHIAIAASVSDQLVVTSQPSPEKQLEFDIDKFTKTKISVDSIIYIEALGNYINIAYENNGIKKLTIRETITNIEEMIGVSAAIYKSHRSYLINLQSIGKITGDSQGLKIHVKNSDKVIPVSRNKIKEFKELLSAKS